MTNAATLSNSTLKKKYLEQKVIRSILETVVD